MTVRVIIDGKEIELTVQEAQKLVKDIHEQLYT